MSPEGYAQRIRQVQIAQLSPEEAEAARHTDELAAAQQDWQAIAADLRSRYPVVDAVWRDGQVGVWDLLKGAGLSTVETSPRANPNGSTTRVVRERVPTLLQIEETPDGIELVFAPLPGQSLATWRAALGLIRATLGLPHAVVDQVGPAMVVRTVDVVRSLPPELVQPTLPVFNAMACRSVLGETVDGPAYVDWANNAGIVVGGVPGSGKTASLLPLFAAMAGHAELHVFDGKAGYDWEPLKRICRTYDASGDLDAVLPVLSMLDELRELRASLLYQQTGTANFWSVPTAQREALRLYPVFVILDEAQTWLDPAGLDRDERDLITQIRRSVRTTVQKGRSAGLILVITSQKPTADTIPTNIRDNCDLRVAFRVKTGRAAEAILGNLPDEAPRPTEIPRATRGRCVLDTTAGLQLVQAYYVEPAVIAAELASQQPVPGQWGIASAAR